MELTTHISMTERQDRLNAEEVPAMARTFFEQLEAHDNELYEDWFAEDAERDPSRVMTLNVPLPSPPTPKQSWWRRLLRRRQPTTPCEHKRVEAWPNVASVEIDDTWLVIHLGIEEHFTPYGQLGIDYVAVDEEYVESLGFTAVEALLASIDDSRKRFAAERTVVD